MTGALKDSAARERILDTAEELFYRQGYNSTGINQIIEESSVAKATFYAHFPTKDNLCLAYLERIKEKEADLVRQAVAKRRTPLAKYMAPIEVLEPWLIETKFRGCPFLNIASEVADEKDPIRKVGAEFYTEHKQLIASAVRDLKKSNPKGYQKLDVDFAAEQYMTILIGAVGLCEIFHSLDPLRKAMRMVEDLVEE